MLIDDTTNASYQQKVQNRLIEIIGNNPTSTVSVLFDNAAGAYKITSSDGSISEVVYPTDNISRALPPQYVNQVNTPVPEFSPGTGMSVLRIQLYGVPDGYYGTVVLELVSDVPLTERLLEQYPLYIQNILSNRTYRFTNQRIIQVELPTGGPANIGWRIKPEQSINTPLKEYVFTGYSGLSLGKDTVQGPPQRLYNVGILYNNATSPDVPYTTILPDAPARYIDIRNILHPLTEPAFTPILTNSGITLIEPYVIPNNAFVATSVSQMYQYVFSNNKNNWVYDVGRQDTNESVTLTIRNITVDTTLQFSFDVASFLKINVPYNFNLTPQTAIEINITLNEATTKNKSNLREKLFTESVNFKVSPLNVTGPVLVYKIDPLKEPVTPPAPTVPVDNSNNTRVFLQIAPTSTILKTGEKQEINVYAYVGLDDGNLFNSKLAVFGPNSFVWKTQNTTVAYLQSEFSDNRTYVNGVSTGNTTFSVEIIGQPLNISSDDWQKACNKLLGTNNVTKTSRGLLTTGNIQVVQNDLIGTTPPPIPSSPTGTGGSPGSNGGNQFLL